MVVEVPLGGSFAAEAFLRETAKADAAAGGGGITTPPQVVVLETAGVVWGAPDDEQQQVRYYFKSLPICLFKRVCLIVFPRHFFFQLEQLAALSLGCKPLHTFVVVEAGGAPTDADQASIRALCSALKVVVCARSILRP